MTIANERFSENAFFTMQVSASAHPMQGLLKALRDVTSYPYGCVEQTTSRCMPMFVLRKYDALVGEVLPKEKNIDAYLQAGIDRLFAMQTNDGGLAYWPGGDRSSAYGSVYALHFLTQVKREHAFDLPLQHFKALQRYAERIVRQENGSASGFYLRAYALYVLALDGDAKALDQIQRFDTVALPRCARLMLAAAIAQNTQDVAKAQFYLGDKPEMPWGVARDDATFGSSIRNEAVELLALTQLQADPQTIAQKADRLFRFLRNEQYSTTQENAFVLMALHAWLESVTDDAESFTEALVEDGAGRHALTGASDYKRVLHKKSEAIRINNTATTPVFVDVLMQGIPREAEMAAVSEGITLQREFYTESGEKVETAVLEQGSAYIVQLTVRASESLPYPVIVDLLPAGLEIQDNRIEADQLPKALAAPKNQPDYTDARDDRIVFSFDSLRRGEHVIYYTVRAVTPGAFQHPAADAECMYQPQVNGNTAVGHVQVITNTAIAGAA